MLVRSPRLVLTSRNRCPALCLPLLWQPVTKQPNASFQQMQPSAAPLRLRRGAWPPPCTLPASSPLPSSSSRLPCPGIVAADASLEGAAGAPDRGGRGAEEGAARREREGGSGEDGGTGCTQSAETPRTTRREQLWISVHLGIRSTQTGDEGEMNCLGLKR